MYGAQVYLYNIHNPHTNTSRHVIYVLTAVSNLRSMLRCEAVSQTNRGNSMQTDQDSWLQDPASKSVKTLHSHTYHVLFLGEMKSASCAHRPSHTKYFIDNKHCWLMWSRVSQRRAKEEKREKERKIKREGKRLRNRKRHKVDTKQQNGSRFCSLCCYNNRGFKVNACLKWEHIFTFSHYGPALFVMSPYDS